MSAPAQQRAAALVPGRDFPRNYAELRAWFPDDGACLDYLEWLRWPEGFVCPRCGGDGSRLADGRHWCEPCHRRVSVTPGTVFHGTRTPLTVWFAVAWYMTSTKNGVAALTLHRLLGFGSYQTVWAMLHRLRRAMVRPGRERLSGVVELDDTLFGGVRPGKRGRGAAGKTLVAVAVELHEPKGFGRCRLQVIPNAKAESLDPFLRDSITPGSTVVTDGLKSYPLAVGSDYVHCPVNVARSGGPAHVLLPGVHRIASLAKRWLLGTHQGAVEGDHLQAYLDEFTFRFNRRQSEFRGLLFRRLLEQCVQVGPVSYQALVVNSVPKSQPPLPPGGSHRARATSLTAAETPIPPPWRAHNR
jgi:transposase-like protein